MSIRFENYLYKREHEKQPRGVGHWAFVVKIKDDVLKTKNCPLEHYKIQFDYSIVWSSSVMSLTDAKNEIKSWLINNDYTDELVLIAD